MKVNNTTMLFEELTTEEANELFTFVETLIMTGKGATIENQFIRAWMETCFPDGVADGWSRHFLLTVSTVFPQRALLSVIRTKGNL